MAYNIMHKKGKSIQRQGKYTLSACGIMALFEELDMGFSDFENERERIIAVRDKFIIECSLADEDAAKLSEVIFFDELLKLYKQYYGIHLVNYTTIIEDHNYDIDEHRYQRIKRMLVRKYREVEENLELSQKEQYINEHIYQRAQLGLRILYEGMEILASYESDMINSTITDQ